MDILEIILIGVGLSMDAAAVSLCKGLAAGKARLGQCFATGVYFGGFQALMPALGFALGSTFAGLIDRYAHWVSFILLVFIGGNMIRESFGEEACCNCSFRPGVMLPLAVATSIDALVVGVSFALYLSVWQMLLAVLIIGVITLVLSAVAVWLGGIIGNRFNKAAQRLGGGILLLIGLKVLLEGLGVLNL